MNTPFVHAFHDTSRPLSIRAEKSLYAEISNHLMMVDYASVNAPTPTPWAWEVWSRFEEPERGILRDLRCVLIHGLALQEFWMSLTESATTWTELEQSILSATEADLMNLIANSIVSGITYYREEMTPQREIDDLLPPNPEQITPQELLTAPELMRTAFRADLISWNVGAARLDHVLDLVLNPALFRKNLLQLLQALWRHGSKQAWEESQLTHQVWLSQARVTIRSQQGNNAPEAVKILTGRKSPEAEVRRVRLDEAQELVLVPCSHLGSSQRIATIGRQHIVMFEPTRSLTTGIATDQPVLSEAVTLLRAITDGPAFSLVQSLAMGDEKYALQLADDAHIHQSTVSRHLATLERTGAVEVRPEGKAKYYRLDIDRISGALAVIGQALTPDSDTNS